MTLMVVPTASGSRKRYQHKAMRREQRKDQVPTASGSRKRYQRRSAPWPPASARRSNRFRFAEAKSVHRACGHGPQCHVPIASANRKRYQHSKESIQGAVEAVLTASGSRKRYQQSAAFDLAEAVSAAIRWVVDSIQVLFQPLPVRGSGISSIGSATNPVDMSVSTASGSRKRYQPGPAPPSSPPHRFQPLSVRGSGISEQEIATLQQQPVPTASGSRKRYQPSGAGRGAIIQSSNRFRFAEAVSATEKEP